MLARASQLSLMFLPGPYVPCTEPCLSPRSVIALIMAVPRAGLAWWVSWGKVSYRPPSLYRVGAFQLIFKDQLAQMLFIPPFYKYNTWRG